MSLGFTFVRIPLIFGSLGLAYAAFRIAGDPHALALALSTSTVAVTLTNVVNLALLRHLVRRDGSRLRDLVGFDRTRLGRDVAWGLCWLFVLYVPFAVVLLLAPLALRTDYADLFVGVYADSAGTAIPIWLGLSIGILFPFLNAPTEELHYRAWAQPRVGIAVMAIAFGLQHVAFAPSWQAALVYAIAFTLWGAGAGLVFRRQRRLVPLIVAHFLTNAPFGVLPYVFALTS